VERCRPNSRRRVSPAAPRNGPSRSIPSPADGDHRSAAGVDLEHLRKLHLLQRGRRDLRVFARRGRLWRLHVSQGLHSVAVGTHQFRVREKDPAGNTDSSPAAYGWTVEASGSCAAPSTVTASASADTWVLQSSSTSNYGSDSVVKVDTKGKRERTRPLPLHASGASLRLPSERREAPPARLLLQAGANARGVATGRRLDGVRRDVEQSADADRSCRERVLVLDLRVRAVERHVAGGEHVLGRQPRLRDPGQRRERQRCRARFHSREKGTDNPPQLVITFR
jgi:hypothetical protein